MNKFVLFSICFLCLLFFACSNETEEESANPKNERKKEQSNIENVVIKLVASEKHLPSNFHNIAVERKEVPYFSHLVIKVETQTQYEEVWSLFNLEQQIVKVDFKANDIYFIGVQESGSCPYELEKTSIENQVMNIHLSEPEGICTAEATPRIFVIEIEKESLDDVKNVVIVQSNVETTVSINDFKEE